MSGMTCWPRLWPGFKCTAHSTSKRSQLSRSCVWSNAETGKLIATPGPIAGIESLLQRFVPRWDGRLDGGALSGAGTEVLMAAPFPPQGPEH